MTIFIIIVIFSRINRALLLLLFAWLKRPPGLFLFPGLNLYVAELVVRFRSRSGFRSLRMAFRLLNRDF